MPPSYSTDIVIFGGGVAGLWLLSRLTAEGFQAILLERDRLGGGQSINSQGIIHGGLKYALHGAFGGASRAIADMPRLWRDCIEGRGEIDLSSCRVLSPHFLLWSGIAPGGAMKAFLGSKAVAGKSEPAAPDEVPEWLRGRGAVYRLPDFVLDAQSLIKALAAPHRNRIHKIDPDIPQFLHVEGKRQLLARLDGQLVEINAKRYIFCAGEGNAELITQAKMNHPKRPACQTRPLKMVAAVGSSLSPQFLHVFDPGFSAKPALTITSHRNEKEETVWYLGGALAEEGVGRSDEAQENVAKNKLQQLFPSLDLAELKWRCLDINRAEPVSAQGRRPDTARIWDHEDVIVAWPTKLTLAPVLADMVMRSLHEDGIEPGVDPNPSLTGGRLTSGLPGPPLLARPYWN